MSKFYGLSDPNEKLCLLVESIVSSIDGFAPLEKSKSQKQSWVTDSTKKILKNRNRLFSKWVQNPTELNKLKYSQARNLATKLIRNEKRVYYDKKVGNGRNSKTLFQAFNEFCKGNCKNTSFLAADVLYEFFASNGEKLRNLEFDYKQALGHVDRIEKSMVFYEITRKEIENAIYKLKNKGSNGHDGINNKIIKLSQPVISVRICSLFKQCVKSGYFPQGLKVAKVIPLFKGGLKDSLENYRPISLLSSLSKIFERIIFNRMYNFANKQKILYEKQFGFQKKKSCVDALIEFTEFIREGWDKKLVGQSCLVDLKKAFDTINHDLLLAKLEKYGFRGRILCLVNNYFTNRFQFVQSSRSMSCGVPQGSVLGPFFFNIYK